jgi:signal transduction histidine kinase
LIKNYNNLGNVYGEKSDFLKSNEIYYKALNLAQELSDKELQAQLLINIAENKAELKDYCAALEAGLRAVKISRELKITYDDASYSCYVGEIYLRIANDLKVTSSNCLYYSGDSKKNLLYAEEFLKAAIDLLYKINDQTLISEASLLLSNVYEKQGDSNKALLFYKNYSQFKDSVFSKDPAFQIAEIEKKQEIELRDKQILIKELTIQKKNSQLISQIVISILILLTISILSYFYNRKRKNQKKLRFDQERIEAEKALIESKLRLSRAEKVAKIGNWKLMLDSKEIIASNGALEIYGLSDPLIPFDLIRKIPLPEYWEKLNKALEDLISNDVPYNLEFKICRVNENKILDIHSIATYDKKSNIVFGVIHDVTERKIAELLIKVKSDEIEAQNEEYQQLNIELREINLELIKAKEHAEESDRLKTAFLQNMSHEIRTPMNAIMGFSSLLIKSFEDKQKLSKFSEIIKQRCADLLYIINDILDIAKIESGQLTTNSEEFNLIELFEELSSFYTEQRKIIGKEHIRLILGKNCSENYIISDKGKLKQILINLIGNAFKFTEEGSIESGCWLDTNNKLTFYVSDTGMGIPIDQQQLIFERFTQLNPGENKLVSGTGLGLSIVKGLARLLEGDITLKSETGIGSTFSFSIPYTEVKPLQTFVTYKSN